MRYSFVWNGLCISHGGVYEMIKNFRIFYRFQGNTKTSKVYQQSQRNREIRIKKSLQNLFYIFNTAKIKTQKGAITVTLPLAEFFD